LVEALLYQPEGSGFDSGGVIGIFHLHNPVCRNMASGLTQTRPKMSTRNIFWRERQLVPCTDRFTTTVNRLS